MSDVQKAAEFFDRVMKDIGGCGDGYCVITGKASGQHTSGGCRCPRDMDPHKVRRMLQAGRQLRDAVK